MTNKKKIMKDYLAKNVDFDGLVMEYKDSWIATKPKSWLYGNGMVNKYFYEPTKKAMEVAGYKYPDSDRTWNTALDVQRELIDEYVF